MIEDYIPSTVERLKTAARDLSDDDPKTAWLLEEAAAEIVRLTKQLESQTRSQTGKS